ncbi:MAG: hypothetical protein Q8P41_22620, partial [Pseudomonadota bacterium]|nr:hypothetical protein [Pseudomonadota bacterium]
AAPAGAAPAPAAAPAGAPAPTAAASGGDVAVSAHIGLLLEKLKEEGAITIDVIRQSSDQSVIDMEKQGLDMVKEYLLKDLFRPVMSTDPAAAALGAATQAMASQGTYNQGTAGGGAKVKIGFELQYKKREELRDVDFDFEVTAPETRTHAPNGFFSALVTRSEKEKHIRTVSLDDPFFKTLDLTIATTADFVHEGLRSMVAEVQYGGTTDAPTVVNSYLFDKERLAPTNFHAFLDQGNRRWRYRVDYQFEVGASFEGRDPSAHLDWREGTGRILNIHPPDDLALYQVVLQSGRVDWDIVDRIETTLTYTDPASAFTADRTWLFDPSTPAQTWTVRREADGPRTAMVAHVWHLKGGARIVGTPKVVGDGQIFVNDPFEDALPIVLDPQVDPANVVRVSVEIHYADPAHGLEVHRAVELVAPYRTSTVRIPLIDSTRRTYTYTVSLVKTGARSENWEPRESDDSSIVITEGGTYFDAQLTLLGDLAAQQIDAVQIDLRAEPLEGQNVEIDSFLFVPGQPATATRRLLIRSDRPAGFEYRVLLFRHDGTQKETPWRRHASRILPLPLAALLRDDP